MYRKPGMTSKLGYLLTFVFVALTSPAYSIQSDGDHNTHQGQKIYAPKGDVLLTVPDKASYNRMTLQILVPDLELKTTTINRETFHKARMTGYGFTSQVGKPQVPVKVFLLAVPEGASLRVRVLGSESVTKSNCKIYPVPEVGVRETRNGELQTVEEFALDHATYSSDNYYPEKIAEIGSYGYLRDVRVARLELSPLQYNPATGILLHHRKIWLEVEISGGSFLPIEGAKAGYVEKAKPFDAIYRNNILNYSPDVARTGNKSGGMWELDTNLDYLDNNPYKISIEEDGVYTIGYQDLVNAGVDIGDVDPRTIKMFNLGEEIAVSVVGEEDGIFDFTDYIEFFGLGGKGEYSFSNIYWLSWGGTLGLRMAQEDCSPGDSLPVPASFVQRSHIERDNRYYSNVHLGDGKDHWFWEQVNAPASRIYAATLPGVSAGPVDARIAINLRGKNNFDHSAQVYINNNLVADCNWSGMFEYENNFSYPQSHLSAGANELSLECYSSQSQIFTNWFDIEYRRDYSAYQGCLRFLDSEPRPNQFDIHGFADSLVSLFRITEPSRVVKITGHSVVSEGSEYKLVFEDTLSQEEYFALTSDCRKTPSSIIKDKSSNLHNPAGRADYVIITHEDYYDGVQPLKDLREAEGLTVRTVKIDDVYDEFNYGNSDPRAIKDFLEYTYYNWPQPAPSYVVLVGDASYDYKGNIPGANPNYVPTHLFVTQTTVETSTDDWFVYLVGDDTLPDMLIGRLTAQTQADVQAQVEKIRNYETNLPEGDWRQKFLLTCDAPDEGGDFEASCEFFADSYIIPAGFEVSKCYVRQCDPACRQCLINAFNEGRIMCTFVGHGSMDSWSKKLILQSHDVASLNNGSMQPFVFTLDCLNGFFHHATDDYCIAEELVRARNKGAIACLSHSGLDYAYFSEILGAYLYDAFFNDGDYILGSAIYQMKTQYLSESHYFWDQAVMLILFGDPALELGFRGKPDLLPGNISFHPLSPVAGEPDTVRTVIFNAGREDASDIAVLISQGHPDSSDSWTIADVNIPYIQAGASCEAVAIWDSVPDAGSYEVFVHVDMANNIDESNEWNNALWDTIRIIPAGVVQDTVPPTVSLFMDDEKVGSDFPSDYYASSSPEIEAVLMDDWTGINTQAILVTLNGKSIDDFELDYVAAESDSVTLRYRPTFLNKGSYTLVVSVIDCAANPNAASGSVRFKVESGLKLIDVKNYPNPSWGNTSFIYSLSQDADVTINIYSVSGHLVRTIKSPGRRNSNVVNWSGTDLNGNKLASGIYLYRIAAKGEGGHVERTGKIVVVR